MICVNLTALLIIIPFSIYGQITLVNDSTYVIDFMQACNSQSISLIGLATPEILTPTDPPALMVSVLLNHNIYNSMAIDIAPAWIKSSTPINFSNLSSSAVKHTVWQSLVISAAYNLKSDNNLSVTNCAVGFKISLHRGHFGNVTRQIIDTARQIDSILDAYYANHISKDLHDSLQMLIPLFSEAKTILVSSLNDLRRFGFKLDFAGGVTFSYPNSLSRHLGQYCVGFWVTPGYAYENGLSILGTVRYVYSPKGAYVNENRVVGELSAPYLDYGLRILYNEPIIGATFGVEFLETTESLTSAYHLVATAECRTSRYTRLTLAVGKDFANSVKARIDASLNFAISFANVRQNRSLQNWIL